MMAGKQFLENEFPEPAIQLIQSLLPRKEAAQTTILSKSWHRAWLTHPNLVLDESDFSPISDFSRYAKKTIKRYEQSNLKIESLKLCMSIRCYAGADLANKLIVKALRNLGATRLTIQPRGSFDLPCELLFGADNLVELSAKSCRINLDEIVIKCCRIESLSLDEVNITRDELYNLISSCPLIEKLSLSNFIYWHRWVGPVNLIKLDRLRCLVLCYEAFRALFPGDLLSNFPLLKEFTLLRPNKKFGRIDVEGIQISNSSVEHIKIELEIYKGSLFDNHTVNIKLDVPSIRKFTFEGNVIPSLSFVSSSTKEWESHVSIARCGNGGPYHGAPNAFWFGELNKFLTELIQSKIHLSLRVECRIGFDYKLGDLSIARKHDLESLMIDMTGLPSFSCYALLDGLFRLCRPKLITQKNVEVVEEEDSDEEEEDPERETNTDLLWHALEQGMYVSIPRQLMYGLIDLEEVNAQIFDDGVMEWMPPIPFKSLLLDGIANQQRVRFFLKWKPSQA